MSSITIVNLAARISAAVLLTGALSAIATHSPVTDTAVTRTAAMTALGSPTAFPCLQDGGFGLPSDCAAAGRQINLTPGGQVDLTPGGQVDLTPGGRVDLTPGDQVDAPPGEQADPAPGGHDETTHGDAGDGDEHCDKQGDRS